MKQLTAEDVESRCLELGFTITTPGFAEYLAGLCNRPVFGPIPVFFADSHLSCVLRNGWIYPYF